MAWLDKIQFSRMEAGIFKILLLCLLYYLQLISGAEPEEFPCGGRSTSPTGVIQTPNFPGPFNVPIKCRWVIDVSDIPSTNSSIVIYLTQLYVYNGLKFTEYAYYESDSMNFGETLLKEVTEGNVFEHRWFRTFRPYLVIEFELDRLEGNHVRVLHDLLDVYGFNITYQMTEEEPNPESCSVQDCSYAGICLVSDDYTVTGVDKEFLCCRSSFSCDCFDGFSGRNCNEGPLCFDDEQHLVCQNGGNCRQIGAEAMACDCPDGYAGHYCELRLLEIHKTECGSKNCIIQCPYVGQEDEPCSCNNGSRVYRNRSRYECRIKLSNVTSLRSGSMIHHGTLETFLAKQLTRYLRNSNITSMEDLKILSVTPASEVTFHFFGNSHDGDKIREALNRLVQRRRLSEIALESTHFTFQQKPALRLQVNEHEVHLGDQFVLTCSAQGSYNVNFTWYKDNMLVNMSKATREIWYRHLPNDGSDLHTSVLTVEKATLLDAGQYTCQVVDWGIQQCKSLYIDVRDEPDVQVVPMSVAVEKGSNVQLTCTTPNMRSIAIGFGWTKNRALLKLEPGSEVWEDLYPAGSILKITNVQKSAKYTCNVGDKSMSVRVEVLNRSLIPICPKQMFWGLNWPETVPGSEALLACPQHFVGRQVSRLCSMRDATTPEWQIPDFFNCLYKPLIKPYSNFKSLTLGYQNTTCSETIVAFWSILRSRNLDLYPGEGDRILSVLAEIERYQYHIDPTNLDMSTEPLLRIINRILDDTNSILSQQKVLLLLQITQRSLVNWSKMLSHYRKHLGISAMVIDIHQLQLHTGDSITHSLQVPADDYTYPNWYGDKVTIRLWRKKQRNPKSNTTLNGVVVVYRNVSQFLPITYVKKLDDGTDLEYRINSRVVTIAVPNFIVDKHNKIWVDLQMKHLQNHSNSWNVSCGIIDNVGAWDLNSCIANPQSSDGTTHCLCPNAGIIAVFLTAHATKVVLAKNPQTTCIVIFGCGSCLVQCLLSAIILGSFWWKNRSCLNFLKLQCCGALAGAMAIFIYAVHDNLPESSYAIVAIGLEAFLLVGMSAPVSETLIIYAGLAQVRPGQHFQPTVIAVITGVPTLAVLATELTHKSTGWRHDSWWLICGSGVYNIFLSCAIMMFLIFVLLYMGALHKAHALVEENVMKKETIEARTRMLHRAAIIICGIIAMETSSVFYINSTSITLHYVFASLSSLLGFLILICYVIAGELTIFRSILRKFKWKHEREEEITSEPIKICSKNSAEVENDTAPPVSSLSVTEPYLEARGIAAGSIDMREFVPEASSSFVKSTVAGTSRFLPEIRIDHTDDINLENYSTSPRKYQDTMSFDPVFASRVSHCVSGGQPYVAKTDCCTFREYGKYHEPQAQIFLAHSAPAESSTTTSKVLCNAEVESRLSAMPDVTLAVKTDPELLRPTEMKTREQVNPIPDIANTTERKQPDGEEMAPEIMITNSEASGMLDRISHDLDYLLNRTNTADGT